MPWNQSALWPMKSNSGAATSLVEVSRCRPALPVMRPVIAKLLLVESAEDPSWVIGAATALVPSLIIRTFAPALFVTPDPPAVPHANAEPFQIQVSPADPH